MKADLTLRKKAHAAWRKNQLLKKKENKARFEREPQLLQEKLRRICGKEFDIRVRTDGERVIAEVDGVLFVSDLRDPFYLRFSREIAETNSGVTLWWKCEKCLREEESRQIHHDYELGEQLESFNPEKSHTCKKPMTA